MKPNSESVHLLVRDKILEVSFKPGLHINRKIAEKIVRDRLFFTHGKPMPAIIISQGLISVDRQAREYLSSEHGTIGLLGTAIIVDSTFSTFIGNFFISVNETNMPARIFSSIPQAKKWLQQFIL